MAIRSDSDPHPHRHKNWEPLTAWRLQSVYGPVGKAIRSVMSALAVDARQGDARADGSRPRILQVGGQSHVLPVFLGFEFNTESSGPECDVVIAAPGETERLSLADRSVDCAVAIDWLPGISPSRRETSVAELCRVARVAVVLVSPFDRPEVTTAIRAVNALYRTARGGDHPTLGRQIELGLPDVDVVTGWFKQFFPSVNVQPLGHLGLWQAAEALAIGDDQVDQPPSATDMAAAATYPIVDTVTDGEPAYRTMIVASVRPPQLTPKADRVVTRPPDFTAVVMHHALEAAGQRRALDALIAAVTVEREREREEFRESLRSLAVELRELDARAEFLSRELRNRDETIANQSISTADAATRVADLEARLASVEPLADAHRRFEQSRAGHALRVYTRLKMLVARRR